MTLREMAEKEALVIIASVDLLSRDERLPGIIADAIERVARQLEREFAAKAKLFIRGLRERAEDYKTPWLTEVLDYNRIALALQDAIAAAERGE